MVDLGNRRTRTTRDRRLSARIDDAVVVLFRTRHRTDDRLRAFHLMIDHRGLLVAHLEAAGHLIRQHLHQFRHRTELLELAKLFLKILQRELVLCHFQKLRLSFLLVDLALYFLDQRQNVAHAEDPLSYAIGIERLDRVVLFADADEFHRLADHLSDRECRTAACIAVHLRQNDARDADAFVEHFGGTHSVLAGHRIRNKKDFDRLCLGLDRFELGHQLVVYVQTAGRVDQQRVESEFVRVLDCTANKLERLMRVGSLIDRNADGIAYDLQLSTCRGTINVHRDEQRLSLLIIA
ncbi:MAG: hypothetical protein JFAIHJKO_00111 [Pyrinomonadaceae bacterium]|nr:hypothetical protein [Pyrinomonadaceae bacterium]